MPKAVCINCNVSLKPETNGVAVAEMCNADTEVYKIWDADLWKCPGCGLTVILGFAERPLAEHYEDRMGAALAYFHAKLKRGEAYVWNEHLKKEVSNGDKGNHEIVQTPTPRQDPSRD